jgi:membrane protein DedA with SNARE-associated domain
VLQDIAHWMQDLIRDAGYPGLFLLIVLESTMVPVPSLLVMPFAGFMASRGDFSLPVILLINLAGALTGSLLSYWLGAYGGKPLILRWGKYVFLKPADLDKTEAFFARYGAWTVLIARFLPVVRHLISIPAGIARMRLPVFLLQTAIGASLWGGGLMVLGYVIGENWESVATKAKKVDLVFALAIVLVIIGVAVGFLWKRRRAARAAQARAEQA